MNVDRVKEDENDWETEAYKELEAWTMTKDTEEEDNVCNMMSMYLTNTNLLSKRMISATSSVDPHRSESELSGEVSELHDDCLENTVSKTQRYIGTGSTIYKRQMDDDGRWWLPVDGHPLSQEDQVAILTDYQEGQSRPVDEEHGPLEG